MNLLQRPSLLQNICELRLVTDASILPAARGSQQPFFNTHYSSGNIKPAYFGRSTISYSQTGKDTPSGHLYEQRLSVSFRNSDLLNAKRIEEYRSVKFIIIKMDGVELILGRNDYFQNTSPVAEIQNTINNVEVSYRTFSIFPLGTSNGSADHLFGEDIPINFFNL